MLLSPRYTLRLVVVGENIRYLRVDAKLARYRKVGELGAVRRSTCRLDDVQVDWDM